MALIFKYLKKKTRKSVTYIISVAAVVAGFDEVIAVVRFFHFEIPILGLVIVPVRFVRILFNLKTNYFIA